jgi:hypothetical protein
MRNPGKFMATEEKNPEELFGRLREKAYQQRIPATGYNQVTYYTKEINPWSYINRPKQVSPGF